MRVHIREKYGVSLRIPIPTSVLLNDLTALVIQRLANSYLKKQGLSLTVPQLRMLFHTLKDAKSVLNDTPFVEISETAGDQITVWL